MARDIARRNARPARSWLALAAGAVAAGALAVGAVAIGQIVIGRLVIGKARFKSLEVDELTVRKLRVIERHHGDDRSVQRVRDAPKTSRHPTG